MLCFTLLLCFYQKAGEVGSYRHLILWFSDGVEYINQSLRAISAVFCRIGSVYVRTNNGITGVFVINKKLIQSITNKDMSRKDFLRYSGVVLLSVLGLKGIIALLSSSNLSTQHKTSNTDNNDPNLAKRSFGSGKYGA